MNRTIFAKIHIDNATLAKQAIESFCANNRILPFKRHPAILSRFEDGVVGTFYGRNKTIFLRMRWLSQEQDSFIIPIGR